MTRKLKTLGLALVAAMALGAVSASAASADQIVSDSPTNTTHLTGVGEEDVFTVPTTGGSVEVKCATAAFSGTFEGETTSATTVTPVYTGTPEGEHGSEHCDGPGGAATIDMNSCAYILTGETDENGDAQVHIECDGEDEIVVTGPACTLSIPAQTPDGGVSYTDDPTEKHAIIVHSDVTGIEYTETGFGCTLLGLHGGNEGTYSGEVTVTGYSDAKHENTVNLDVDTT